MAQYAEKTGTEQQEECATSLKDLWEAGKIESSLEAKRSIIEHNICNIQKMHMFCKRQSV